MKHIFPDHIMICNSTRNQTIDPKTAFEETTECTEKYLELKKSCIFKQFSVFSLENLLLIVQLLCIKECIEKRCLSL